MKEKSKRRGRGVGEYKYRAHKFNSLGKLARTLLDGLDSRPGLGVTQSRTLGGRNGMIRHYVIGVEGEWGGGE